MKVYEALARALTDGGVSTLFGLMGDANMLYVSAFRADPGSEFIGAVSEGAAVSMADGYARTGDAVGVVTVTHGPGATNGITALTEAVRARTPLVFLTGETPGLIPAHGQVIDLVKIADLAGAAYIVSRRPEQCVGDLRRALAQARVQRRPVLLNLPVDFMQDEVVYVPPRPVLVAGPLAHVSAESETIDAALGLLASARRPVVLAGRGAVRASARDEIVRLADTIGAPVGTTLMGREFFAGHPLDLGIIGSVGSVPAMDAVAAADCVITFGAGLNRHTTSSGALFEGTRVIQCDVDPGAFGKTGPADIQIVGDARHVAGLLADALAAAGVTPPEGRNTALAATLATHRPLEGLPVDPRSGVVDMRLAVDRLDSILPADRQLISDTGRFNLAAWPYLRVADPSRFTHAVHFGSIGLALATGIGMAVRDRSCPTVVVAGDGGGMMSLIELQTAVRLGLPLVVVILNDGCYGAEWNKLEAYGMDPEYSLLSWPEFTHLASAMGAHARTVREMADFDPVREDVAAGRFPLLIDVKCDPRDRLLDG